MRNLSSCIVPNCVLAGICARKGPDASGASQILPDIKGVECWYFRPNGGKLKLVQTLPEVRDARAAVANLEDQNPIPGSRADALLELLRESLLTWTEKR